MALIGEMQYLTIGGNTYSIPTNGGSTVTIERALTSGTKSATISVDGTSYDLYAPTPNAGTVTSVRVQATSPVQSSTSTAQSSTLNTTISLANGYGDTKNPYASKTKNYVLAGPTTGSAAAPSFRALVAADIPDLSEIYLTSYTETDPTVPSWAKASTKPTYTASEVGAVATSAVGAASGVVPLNASSKIDSTYLPSYVDDVIEGYYYNNKFYTTSAHTTQITGETGKIFVDLSTNKTYRYSGSAFTEVSQGSIVSVSRSLTSGTKSATITVDGTGYDLYAPTPPTVPTNVSAFTNDAGYITSADVPEGASAYTGTISAVGTTASNGTNNGFARGDHVHNITSSTITSALGYTPYDSTNPNGYISSYTDEKLKWTASTTSNTYYPLQSTSTATTSTANTLNGISFYQYYNTTGGYRRLDLGNSTAYKSTGGAYGTIRLYGAAATYYGDLVPGVLGTTSGDGHISANRTWTLPDKTGTIALTSDIPTTLPASDVSAWAKASSKPTYTASEVGALASNTTYVSTVTTTAGAHSAITSKSGTVSFNVPTHTSHLTNDSGFITSDSDENVKSTAVTAATTNYIVGSTNSSTNTGGLSKHASAIMYTTANSGTSGYTQLRLGNTTATSSAGGKEGQIRLYGTNATYYLELKPGAIASSNKTITFPNKTGTVALTSDIPDTSSFLSSETDPVFSASAAAGITSTDISNWNTVDTAKTLANNALGRVSSAYLPAGTNIDTSSIETGVYVYERLASGRNVQGTFPMTDNYGTLIHINGTSANYAMQIIRSNNNINTVDNIYKRFKVSSTWGEWIMIPTREEVDALKSEQDLRSKEHVGRIGILTDKNIDNFATNKVYGTWWLNHSDNEVTGTKPASSGQGLLICKQQSATLYRQVYIGISGNEFKYRYHDGSTWTAWTDTPIRAEVDALPKKTSFSIRTVTWSYTAAGNSSTYTNLYTLINNDLPSGGTCLGIVGYSTNNSGVLPVSVQYANSNYSAQVRNITSSSITANMNVRYLCLV